MAHSSQTEARQVGDIQAHRVVQVDWRAQLAATQKQLEQEPNSSFLHGQAAVAYDALGDFKSFESEIQTAMRLDPRNSMPCYMAYAVYKRKRLTDKQTSALDAALKIDPDNPFGRYEKASMLEDAQDFPNALKEYETAQRLLQRVTSDRNNLQKGRWTYIDRRGNHYDVTQEELQVSNDIVRVRTDIQDHR